MQLNLIFVAATLLAASIRIAAAADAPVEISQSVVHGGFELRGGRLFSLKNRKALTSQDETVSEFTVSPDGKFLVYVRRQGEKVSLWTLNVRSGKRIQAGKDLAIGCCVLVNSIDNKGFGSTVSFINGAFWTKTNEALVSTLTGGMDFFLSMNGTLKGDV